MKNAILFIQKCVCCIELAATFAQKFENKQSVPQLKHLSLYAPREDISPAWFVRLFDPYYQRITHVTLSFPNTQAVSQEVSKVLPQKQTK